MEDLPGRREDLRKRRHGHAHRDHEILVKIARRCTMTI